MTASAAKGSLLSWSGSTIGGIQSFDGPSIANPTIDVSDLSDSAREKISSGLMDPGQVTGSLWFDASNATHALLVTDCIAGNTANVVITLPDTGGTMTYSAVGIITEITPSASTGEAGTTSFTIDLTGTLTFTA